MDYSSNSHQQEKNVDKFETSGSGELDAYIFKPVYVDMHETFQLSCIIQNINNCIYNYQINISKPQTGKCFYWLTTLFKKSHFFNIYN